MLSILRLGHRPGRDERVSTHVGLVARAFGAGEVIYSGEQDDNIVASMKKVTEKWGGPLKVRYEQNWRKTIKAYRKKRFNVCHLTMYGIPVKKSINKIRKHRNVLVVVGSEKVPFEVYANADYNISVTSQPHSEVAALAVFLHEYFKGKELSKKFKKAKIMIVPQERGKKVVEK